MTLRIITACLCVFVLAGCGQESTSPNKTTTKTTAKQKPLVIGLERPPDVPENAIALGKDFDESLRSSLLKALLNMHLDPEGKKVLEQFGAQRFIETRNEDYDIVRHYAEHMPLNLGADDLTYN